VMSLLTECPQGSPPSMYQTAFIAFSAACWEWKHACANLPTCKRIFAVVRSSLPVISQREASTLFFSALIDQFPLCESSANERPIAIAMQFLWRIDEDVQFH